MKRTFLLLLCLALLLSGCSQALQQNTAVSTESISLLPQPFDFTLEAKPEETVKTVYQVAADYSQYAPKESLSPLYTRLKADWIPDLKESDDYGHIYPFVGSALYNPWDTGYYVSDYLYGMIDESGRIIADPTYVDISLLQEANPDEYLYSSDYLPMWVLERNALIEEGDAQSIFALATLDGSMVTDCKYNHVSGYGDYAIATETLADDSLRFDLFDMQGNLICTSENLSCLKKSGLRPDYIYYSDGMLLFLVRGENWTYSHYYTDLSGRTLLGPYSYGGHFFDGYAVVELENNHYAYINSQGKVLNNMEFHYAQPFIGEMAIATKLHNDGTVLLSASGKVLLEAAPEDTLDYNSYSFRHVSGSTATYYGTRGNVLYGGSVPNHWIELGGGLFSADKEIVDNINGERYSISEHHPDSYVNSYYRYGLPYLAIVWWDYESYSNHYSLINTDFDLILDDKNLGKNGYAYVITDHLEDKAYLHVYDGSSYAIYGEDAFAAPMILPAGKTATLSVYNGRVLYKDETCCAYYDLEGTLLFCYPLTSVGGD